MATLKKRAVTVVPRGLQEHNEVVYEAIDSGNFYITSERLLFETSRLDAIELGKVEEVQIQAHTKLLMVLVKGEKSPRYYEVPKPFVAQAYIERILQEAEADPPE